MGAAQCISSFMQKIEKSSIASAAGRAQQKIFTRDGGIVVQRSRNL